MLVIGINLRSCGLHRKNFRRNFHFGRRIRVVLLRLQLEDRQLCLAREIRVRHAPAVGDFCFTLGLEPPPLGEREQHVDVRKQVDERDDDVEYAVAHVSHQRLPAVVEAL